MRRREPPPRMTVLHELYVGGRDIDFAVDAWPADDDMCGGAAILIQFNDPGSGYGINSQLLTGANDWRRWRQAIAAALFARFQPEKLGFNSPRKLPRSGTCAEEL